MSSDFQFQADEQRQAAMEPRLLSDTPATASRAETRRNVLGMTLAATAAFIGDRALLAPSSAQAEGGVTSVNGKTGVVVLAATDVGAVPAADLVQLPGENTAIGEGAFANFVSESEKEHEKHRGNTAFGWHAMHNFNPGAGTSSEDNTAVGSQALAGLTTGGGNTAVGENAGLNLTSGEENVAIGCETLSSQTTASGNNAVGFRALYENKSGTGNNAFGYASMANNTSGNENTAFGQRTNEKNLVGFRIAAFGFEALRQNTGQENTALGGLAGKAVTTGEQNTLVGALAGNALESGSRNVVVGLFALSANKTGGENTAIGTSAGAENEGSGNVFLGRSAGRKEKGSNKLYIAATETTEPLVLGVFPNSELTFNTTKIALYKGVTPVARHATISAPAETTAANTKAIKEIIEAIKAIGIIL